MGTLICKICDDGAVRGADPSATGSYTQLRAFPGAEGMAAFTRGAAGYSGAKSIAFVDNLNDSGPGSFREACAGAGKEGTFIIFRTSGIINLTNNFSITSRYLTFAGQTSPGGILITGRPVVINASDIIMRHMRYRVGSHNIDNEDAHDSLQVLGHIWGPNTTDNLIFDHCSIGWGVDENCSLTGGITNVTVQWSIIAEGLRNGKVAGDHSKGMLIGGDGVADNSISLHHNYYAHNSDRNPLLNIPDTATGATLLGDAWNNVVYNWQGGLSPLAGNDCHMNWQEFYCKQGPDSNAYSREITHEAATGTPGPYLYVKGNIGSTRLLQSDPHWNVGNHWMDEDLPETWRRLTPWAVSEGGIITPMTAAYAAQILQTVGANKPFRDAVDTRIIDDFTNTTGAIRSNVSYPADFPTYSTPAPPTDTNGDGIPDQFEIDNGFAVGTMDPLAIAPSGRLRIEDYVNELA
ncbi:MAG: hypothetical protein KZQ95_01800 [Candidatus Thiodiazotropha sp. (ex Epidulcina cf. delphinae)]|nr:hypothetical protein [Candidatus Thiodiazotropha sp. (ex Epidulcina cf. delphinae)]